MYLLYGAEKLAKRNSFYVLDICKLSEDRTIIILVVRYCCCCCCYYYCCCCCCYYYYDCCCYYCYRSDFMNDYLEPSTSSYPDLHYGTTTLCTEIKKDKYITAHSIDDRLSHKEIATKATS